MTDITGMANLGHIIDYKSAHTVQIRTLVEVLGTLGIKPERIWPSYCAGGRVVDLTSGKYTFDANIPEDTISKDGFLAAGIPAENLIRDRTRDTFLSLHLGVPTPWGYRNEVNVNLGTDDNPVLLDIATLEYLPWTPVFRGEDTLDSKDIVGVKGSTSSSLIGAFGLERLCMVVNGLERVQDVDYIKPVHDRFREITGTDNPLIVESLRALHRVYSDITTFGIKLGRHHKLNIRGFLRNIPRSLDDKVKDLLKAHTVTQPWHSELKAGIEPTIERIKKYRLDS